MFGIWKNGVTALIRMANVQIERLKVEREIREQLKAIVRELQTLNAHHANLLGSIVSDQEVGTKNVGGQR
jgi:hypothetical protein